MFPNTTNRSGNIKSSGGSGNAGNVENVGSCSGAAAKVNSSSNDKRYSYTRMARSNESFDNLEDEGYTGDFRGQNYSAKSGQINRPHVLEVNKYDVEFADADSAASSPQKRSSTTTNSTSVLPTPTSTPSHKSQTSLSSRPPEKPRSGPSSRRTVLVIASFFVVGTIFMVSGIIVLCTQRHPAFDTAGAVFVAVGAVSYVLCLFLQQKNVRKLMKDLEQDLYFLNIHQSPLLRTFFSFDGNTAANGTAIFRPSPRA